MNFVLTSLIYTGSLLAEKYQIHKFHSAYYRPMHILFQVFVFFSFYFEKSGIKKIALNLTFIIVFFLNQTGHFQTFYRFLTLNYNCTILIDSTSGRFWILQNQNQNTQNNIFTTWFMYSPFRKCYVMKLFFSYYSDMCVIS